MLTELYSQKGIFSHTKLKLSIHQVSINKIVNKNLKKEIQSSAQPSTWSIWCSYPSMVVSHQTYETADLLPGQSNQQESPGTSIYKNCFLKIIFSRTNQLKCVFTNVPSAISHKILTFSMYQGNELCTWKDKQADASSSANSAPF